MDPNKYVQRLDEALSENAIPEDAAPMAAYMKEQFEFHGIKSKARSAVVREHVRQYGMPEGGQLKAVCRLCFAPEAKRELQYCVNNLLQRAMRKLDPTFLDLVEELLPQKSWWDTVDFLSPKIAGQLLLKFPQAIERYPDRWIESDDFWFQRAAIIHQLHYKDKTDAERLFRYVLRRASSDEFFVQKAAGWALRNYARVDPEAVRAFLAQHDLPTLTVREGGKHL